MRNSAYILILALLFSCGSEEEKTQEQEAQILADLLSEIEALASSVPCEDSKDWTFVGYGCKACGGVQGFLPYSTKIDVSDFLDKVNHHASEECKYNIKWGIISTCDISPAPVGVDCTDGKAVLIYDFN